MEREFYQYLTPSISDKNWGVYINVAGYGDIKPDTAYPQKGHPSGYYFTWEQGRQLDEFQIIYITEGYGILETKDHKYVISPGTIITLLPNIWHRYRPDPKTGWKEYYIGFQGEFANQHVMNKYCNYMKKPAVYIGFQEKILDIFNKLIEEVKDEKIGYQQVCSGLLIYLIGNIVSVIRNKEFGGTIIKQKILKARLHIRGNIYNNIDMEELAADLNISYSYFRTMFKKYTGISPSQYHLLLKLQRARELIISSNKSIKEISNELNFHSIYYFSQIFKQKMGVRPSKLRQ